MNQHATVLVVDDDPDTVETMRDILEEEGHTVLSARNGREALEVALRSVPDLVLLDLDMPVMDGRAFLEAVRRTPELSGITVVVLSGAVDGSMPCESVQKPLRLDTLLGLIERVANAAPAGPCAA
jgi:two-component system OmpR family response regulator